MARFMFVLFGILWLTLFAVRSSVAEVGYADVVLDFHDSGTGPMQGPYGGTSSSFPISVSLEVVLGNDPGPTGFEDFLSLPTGSFVTVGFTDESIVDGPGDDIFIKEVGAAGEKANVFVSSDGSNFTFLGIAQDDTTTSFDLASINFTANVSAVKIVGLDNFGSSPGFDVVHVQVLPESIAPPQTIEISATPTDATAAANSTASFEVTVENIGEETATYAVTGVSSLGWTVNPPPEFVVLPGESQTVTIEVEVPDAVEGTSTDITITAQDVSTLVQNSTLVSLTVSGSHPPISTLTIHAPTNAVKLIIKAKTLKGWEFVEWDGHCKGKKNKTVVKMNQDKECLVVVGQ